MCIRDSGGASWVAQSSGVQATLYALSFQRDALHGYAAGASGTLLRTVDGGTTWLGENAGTTASLKALGPGADWNTAIAVGAGGVVSKRAPSWAPDVLFATETASLAPPALLPSANAALATVFAGNNSGSLYAIQPENRTLRYEALALTAAIAGRTPAVPLAGESNATLFVATMNGFGYAFDALTGTPRWTCLLYTSRCV